MRSEMKKIVMLFTHVCIVKNIMLSSLWYYVLSSALWEAIPGLRACRQYWMRGQNSQRVIMCTAQMG